MPSTSRADGDIDRARYQFQILSDTAAELHGVRNPHKILESFLLSAMGGLGARGGFAAILGQGEFHMLAQSSLTRSLTPEYARVLRTHLDALDEQSRRPFFVPALQGDLCPGKCELLLVCPLDEDRDGVIGLEANLSSRSYDENDRQLVAGLGTLFQISLRFSLLVTRSEMLNAELTKRHDTLDRQIYHLSSLRELTREIVRVDMPEAMDIVLLTVLGHFARTQGLLVLRDRSSGRTMQRATGGAVEISDELVDHFFYLCLAGASNKHLQPLHVEPVATGSNLHELHLGFEPDRAYLFTLREGMFGAVLLGPSLGPPDPAEDEMLQAFVSQGVMHLKNADSFATISTLNEDLARQNEALRQTISELTSAKDQISVLEAAGRRISGIIHSKAESLTRVRPVDFLLIISLSLVMAVAFNFQNPRGIPWLEPYRDAQIPILGWLAPAREETIPVVNAMEARELVSRENALLIDARPREFFERSHVESAVNIPSQLFDLVYMMQMVHEDPERPVVVYGRSVSRLYDRMVAGKFLRRDHERVYIVEDSSFWDSVGRKQ